jgi:hypothetical protein
MPRIRSALFLALAVAVGLAVGCKKSNVPASVSGKVTYKGGPVKGGNIAFHTEEGQAYRGSLNEDGSYSVTSIPAGDMKVTVETESFNPEKAAPAYPRGGGAGPAMDAKRLQAERKMGVKGPPTKEELAAKYVKIPKDYSDPKKTKLTVTLGRGRQSGVNFELKD